MPPHGKAPKAKPATVNPTIRQITEIRFCDVNGPPIDGFDSPNGGDFFTGKINSQGNVEIIAPCGEEYASFAPETIKELVKLLGL